MGRPPTLVPFLLLTLFLLSATLVLSYQGEDPRQQYEQCKQQCQQQQYGEQQRECERQCEEEYREQRERGRGGEGRDPRQQYEQCQQHCRQEQRGEHQQRECERQCKEEYREQRERGRGEELNKEGVDSRQQYEQCQRQCQQHHRGERQQRECERQCEEEYREQRERGHGGEWNREDPRQQYEQCQRQCQQQERGQQRRCEQLCEEEYRESRGREGNPGQEEMNPYFYGQDWFSSRISTQHGNVKVLERFSRRSEFLRGIENYRVAILELNPKAFVLPNHWDAEAVLYVAHGRANINLIRQEGKESLNLRRESHNLEQGDVFRVPAGTTVYLVNRDNNEKLYIVKVLQPVFTPGQYEHFFAAGGQNPQSFFQSFSDELLQAAFNAPKEKLQRMFGQHREGAIIRATDEQIKEMSQGTSSSKAGRWPFGESSSGPFNLLNKRPSYSNDHGKLFEVDANDYQPLRDLDISVSFANITRGSMTAPYYYSKSTKISMVLEGNGHIEIVCPHVTSSGERRREEEAAGGGQQQQPVRYEKLTAPLSPGAVLIVPAGHPTLAVASGDKNLHIVCFELNAKDNQRYYLAGQNNILNELEREAKELSFNMPAKEVEEILNAQKETAFLPGPQQHQERERGEGRADL
ncbi:vicilin Cor a 11.0101-like [Tasmannia lanceolata]|uniref:vicilin Cor a 11.0101-like n=1 Tax=Tasmannia lanceolata TaxID=3420 RepID=UPI0040631B00